MLLIVLVCSLSLAVTGQQADDDDWIDPFDMLNYDASIKTMRKPAEPANYDNVPTARRKYTQKDPSQAELTSCNSQIEELEKKIKLISQRPTCHPVFMRFLRRLLKEIQRVGLPSDSTDAHYDAKIKLSRQDMTEIQMLLEGEDSWRTGALDNAISQILVDLRPHDYEAWKWRFVDTCGVELDELLKMLLVVLVIVAIICTQWWSTVSWFMQFRRLFAISFLISVVWNWLYLYKTAFADHQNNIAKMNSINEKCTGMKKIDWTDSLKEWVRSTWTFQDDPCKKYYEVLMVNPILLVPPTKAFTVTITTLITEPLKHIGQGISEFLVALLKDLPVTLQIPVFLAVVLIILVCMYGSVQAAFQHGITAPFRRIRDPTPPPLEQPRRHLQEIEDYEHLAGGDAPQLAPRHLAYDGRLNRNQVHQRRHNRPREERAKVDVVTVRTAEAPYSEDETDAVLREAEQNLSAESDSENQEELAGASASSVAANKSKTTPAESDSSQSKTKPLKVKKNLSKDELTGDDAASRAQPAARRPSQTDVQDLQASAEDRTSSFSLTQVETVGVSVQESSAISAE
ncbi:chloride channel CLIC-like protein 1 isoform X2 [Siniperca chuatsi]|uniref:chloride channel CLIC-like protein 1 isoform X2 n=2 Tax=Siniperca chuatsi TaxID=119488 RepID=UPI001CE117F3|nr:chloride channel CLIC-like protein 1 isoform X2 [Siniperca chuatsi]XP_044055978.1 chloride channel CLIC-like protein 1 isoform X2 [Siniperca chuatsi]